jgi:signal transduction histidine kinase
MPAGGETGTHEQAPSMDLAHPSRAYTAVGAALGLGAPIGFFLLTRIAGGRTTGRWNYAYMTLTTPVFFALFGNVLGREEERRRTLAREMQKLREEFVSVVAHDLRNPLQAILLQVDALLRHAEAGGTAVVPVKALQRVQAGGERLSQMVDDLLDASRIEASRLSIHRRAVDVVDAVDALVDRIRATLLGHPTEIEVEGSPGPVLADPTRLDQILTNLLENAAKYSTEGAPIRIGIEADQGGTRVTVEDQGPGIAPEDVPRLFDRFFQTKRAREKKTGLGLGLYITKGLVEAHGGRIRVTSVLGRGSKFSVWLPAAPPSVPASPLQPAERPPHALH